LSRRRDIVIERIQALLATPTDGRGAPSRDYIESTLTEGYAEALALDGERLRLGRRLEQVTMRLAHGKETRTDELSKLVARLDEAEDDLATLRELLAALRRRVAKAA